MDAGRGQEKNWNRENFEKMIRAHIPEVLKRPRVEMVKNGGRLPAGIVMDDVKEAIQTFYGELEKFSRKAGAAEDLQRTLTNTLFCLSNWVDVNGYPKFLADVQEAVDRLLSTKLNHQAVCDQQLPSQQEWQASGIAVQGPYTQFLCGALKKCKDLGVKKIYLDRYGSIMQGVFQSFFEDDKDAASAPAPGSTEEKKGETALRNLINLVDGFEGAEDARGVPGDVQEVILNCKMDNTICEALRKGLFTQVQIREMLHAAAEGGNYKQVPFYIAYLDDIGDEA